MRFLVGVLVIALVALTLPAGPCCIPVTAAPSHSCCRTQCLNAATAATIVKVPAVLAVSIAPAMMRVVAIVSHQHCDIAASTRPLESIAPLPLRI